DFIKVACRAPSARGDVLDLQLGLAFVFDDEGMNGFRARLNLAEVVLRLGHHEFWRGRRRIGSLPERSARNGEHQRQGDEERFHGFFSYLAHRRFGRGSVAETAQGVSKFLSFFPSCLRRASNSPFS